MDEKWLQDIHNKMENFQTAEPSGLWQNVTHSQSPGKHRRSKWLWAPAFVAVASILVFTGTLLRKNGPSPQAESPIATVIPNPSAQIQEASPTNVVTIPTIMRKAQMTDNSAYIHEHLQQESSPSESAQHSGLPQEDLRVNAYENDYFAQARPNHRQAKRISIGVSAEGGAGASLIATNPGKEILTGIGADNADWEDSPALGIAVYNQGRKTQTNLRHHLPLRLGVNLAYQFDNRWKIESGVTYTMLYSQMRDGSSSHYTDMDQTLHYMGIPLNLKCRIVSGYGFEMYGSIGGSLEKCIQGTQTTSYVLSGERRDRVHENIGAKPLQWSVGVAAGAQYLITQDLGIYIEPGIRYYFDDGTTLKTIYKERPLNFSLTIGIRLGF